MGWRKASGYNERAPVGLRRHHPVGSPSAMAEAAISRYKHVIGDGLRSSTDRRRAAEVDVGGHALDRRLEFGRPNCVRTATA